MNAQAKTLLLHLPDNIDDVSDYSSVIQPYGLAIISAFLKKHGKDVTLFDAAAYHTERKEILRLIEELRPDILALTLFTSHLPKTIPLLKDVRLMLPDVTTVVGGPHPSAENRTLLEQYEEIDLAVEGEGEYAMLEILESMENGGSYEGIPGVTFRQSGGIVTNERRESIQDLDSLPFADWDSLPMENYVNVWTVRKNYLSIPLSRGCPFHCTFCGAKKALGKGYRKRSPESVLEELKLLYDRHHIRDLLIGDSTFNLDQEWVAQICEGMLDMQRPFIWGCNMRADRVDKEVLKLMRKSGCERVFIGVESADNRMLKNMRKGESIEKIEEGILAMIEVGLTPDMGYILGMPGETEESLQKTISFAKKFKKSIPTFTIAAPYPGTEFYEQAKKEGFIVKDWSKFDSYSIAYIPEGLTREKLSHYYRMALRSTYYRFSYVFTQLFRIKSWLNFKITVRFAYRVFVKRFLRRE